MQDVGDQRKTVTVDWLKTQLSARH